ncbi:MAG: hypothetical protein CM1200mP7_2920 [Chloroflexota bacterium]|nr:MAG: hypothetical protein CM1200mP7_2920 [Chloroflexota bacterium]
MANNNSKGTWEVKSGLAQMLKGGVIMDVVTADQAKIAEDVWSVFGNGFRKGPLQILEKMVALPECQTPQK